MKIPIRFLLMLLLTGLVLADPNERKFDFTYEATMENLVPGSEIRMWSPLPQETSVQKVSKLRFASSLSTQESLDSQGNRILYLTGRVPKNGQIVLEVKAKIERQEWLTKSKNWFLPQAQTFRRDLQASRLVPTSGPALDVAKHLKAPAETRASARQIYDLVLGHLNYDKSNPGYGNGDSLWACDSRTGNCTDFHSLFLSLVRSRSIPARFEIGFPLPELRGEGSIGGYHCWASFWSDTHDWTPVDISEADKHPEKAEYFFGQLDPNRVSLSLGRDLVFEPEQASGPANYFVEPLVELNGVKQSNLVLKVSYQDLD